MEHLENEEHTESGVDLRGYLYLLWSWAWLILLAAALAGGVALFVSMRMTPIYRATTKLLVSAPSTISGVDPAALVTAQTMTSTYSEMLLDRPVLEGVIEQLHLAVSAEDLRRHITVETVINTQLLVIAVEDSDPLEAANIANALASVFAARIRELQSQRYSASREGLAKQVSDMEQQLATTANQIAAIEQQMAAAATQTAAAATQTMVATSQPRRAATPTAEDAPGQLPPAVDPLGAAPALADPATLVQLQARLTQYRTIYSNLVTSFEQVRLSEDQTSTNVVVSEPAAVETKPVRPKPVQYTILALVAGTLLAAGAVLAVDALDDTIRNPETIRKRFGVPILGMIYWHEAPPDRPISVAEPRCPTAEAFRALRTNIMYAAVDRPLRRLMITSPTPQDGKTTVASNLAAVIAQNEKQVLLIDADMRRPQIHRKFGLHNRIGLSELFVRSLDTLASVIQPTAVQKLAILTSGGIPPNPSELLSSKMMGQILERLDHAFEVIVLDTPPVLSVTDAPALAAAVDGVVLVARPGTTKLGAFQQGLEQLRAVNARVLGVVMNEVHRGSRKYGYYYNRYYSKYSHYYESGGAHQPKSRRRNGIRPNPQAGAPK